MPYRSVKGFTGTSQIGLLMVFLGLGFILAGAAQFLISLMYVPAGTSMTDFADAMLKAMKDPANVGYARLSQVIGTLCLLCIPAWLFSRVVNGPKLFWLGFNRYVNIRQVLIGFLIIFCANILAGPLADLSKSVLKYLPSIDTAARSLEDAYNEQVLILSNLRNWPEYLMAILIMAFFPALFEEMFFRGALQNLLVRWWKVPVLGIIATSLLFSLIHSSIYLFLSRAVLGFALGLMYHETKNIWVNVVAHFLNNLLALTQLFFLSRTNQKVDVEKIDPRFDWWVGVIAIAGLYFLFRVLRRISEMNRLRANNRYQVLMETESDKPLFIQKEGNNHGI